MKTIAKLLSLLSLTVLAAAPLLRADEPPAPPAAPPAAGDHVRPDRATMQANRLKMLTEKLQLTATQQQQVTGIWSQSDAQGKALRHDESLSRDDRRAKMRDIMKAAHDQIRALLTPDQQKTFDAMPPEGHGHRGPPRGDGDEAPPPPQSPQ